MTTLALAPPGACTCTAPKGSRFHSTDCALYKPRGLPAWQQDQRPARPAAADVRSRDDYSQDEKIGTALHRALICLRAGMTTYLRIPDYANHAYAGWIVHTHFREKQTDTPEPGQLIWEATPRFLFAGDKNTGKSAAAAIALHTVGNPDFIDVSPTIYGLAAALNENKTVLLDEAHRYFVGANGRATRHQDAQSIFTGGYTRGAIRRIGRSSSQVKTHVFGPMLLCARPALLKAAGSEELDDLLERCITVPTRKVSPPPPVMKRSEQAEMAKIQASLAVLGMDPRAQELVLELAEDYIPDVLPAGLDGRQRQLWTPLAACAALAGKSPEPGATAHLPELLAACERFTQGAAADAALDQLEDIGGAFAAGS